MPQVNQNVVLLRYTPDPDEVVSMGARICYSRLDIAGIGEKVGAKDQSQFIEQLMDMGHYSPVEHASFTFGIEGVSRALLAQITRHRIASFSVQSMRYVSMAGDFPYVIPPRIEALGEEAVARYRAQMEQMQGWYEQWQEALGGENEDARFVLPNATATRMILTMNARELLHFFKLRCCERAQWEIRALAWEMLRQVKQVAPALFRQAGPSCVSGECPEGKKSCGRMEAQRERVEALDAEIRERREKSEKYEKNEKDEKNE